MYSKGRTRPPRTARLSFLLRTTVFSIRLTMNCWLARLGRSWKAIFGPLLVHDLQIHQRAQIGDELIYRLRAHVRVLAMAH